MYTGQGEPHDLSFQMTILSILESATVSNEPSLVTCITN
jgi:hypothetical protein